MNQFGHVVAMKMKSDSGPDGNESEIRIPVSRHNHIFGWWE